MNQEEPISHDLRALVNAEIPLGPGRHIVKWTMLLFAVLVVSAFSVVSYALWASLNRESNLHEQTDCIRESAVQFDSAVGAGAQLLVDQNTATSDLVVALANEDPQRRTAALARLDQLVAEGVRVKAMLDAAIKTREASLEMC